MSKIHIFPGRPRTIYGDRELRGEFLFSGSASGVEAPSREKVSGIEEDALQSAFPGVLVGTSFVERSLERVDDLRSFVVLAIRADRVVKDAKRAGRKRETRVLLEIAALTDRMSREAGGWWGLWEKGVFASFFPDEDTTFGLAVAERIAGSVRDSGSNTVTVGVAAFPTVETGMKGR